MTKDDGKFKFDVMRFNRKPLDYISKTGLDCRISDSGVWKVNMKEVIDRLGQSITDETAGLLPIPYTLGSNTLSKKIMEVYDIKTKKDLAKYLRIAGIIISKFEGPEKYDHLNTFVNRLQVIFKEQFHAMQEYQIIRSLKIYEQHVGIREQNHKLLTEKDYISLARILNAQYELYDPKQKIESDAALLQSLTIELLGKKISIEKDRARLYKVLSYHEVIDPISLEEFEKLTGTPDYRINLLKKIRAFTKEVFAEEYGPLLKIFKTMWCGMTDERLIKIRDTEESLKALFSSLDYLLLCPVKTKEELKALLNKTEERAKLCRRIHNFCMREFGGY
jgi:hypothetical protein